jgi:hypothetical protein
VTQRVHTMLWPPDRTSDVFCRWFDYQHYSMLIFAEALIHK